MAPIKRAAERQLTEHVPGAGTRCGLSVADLKQSFLDNLFCGLGRVPLAASRHDAYTALALTVRDRVLMQGVETLETYAEQDVRVVAYLEPVPSAVL